jgi:hypothetical protein
MQCSRLTDQGALKKLAVPSSIFSGPAMCSVGCTGCTDGSVFTFLSCLHGSATNVTSEPNRPEWCTHRGAGRRRPSPSADARPAVRGQNAALPVHVSSKAHGRQAGRHEARHGHASPDRLTCVHSFADGYPAEMRDRRPGISTDDLAPMAPRKKNGPCTDLEEHRAVRCWGSRVHSRRLASSPPCHTGGLLSPAGLFSALNT